METCFDFSRCPYSSGFQVYVYDIAKHKSLFHDVSSQHLNSNPDEACVFIHILADPVKDLDRLSHWNGDGRNHILISDKQVSPNLASQLQKSRAILASQDVGQESLRPSFDFVLPHFAPLLEQRPQDSWKLTHNLLPIKKRYLITFHGNTAKRSESEKSILEHLKGINDDNTDDQALIKDNCDMPNSSGLCGTLKERLETLGLGTFALIMSPEDSKASTLGFQIRLHEALRAGTVPVIVGLEYPSKSLPFSELIDWKRLAVLVPSARAPELHFLLRSLSDTDLFSMQRQGNLAFKSYFISDSKAMHTFIQVLRERVGIPPLPLKDLPSPSVFKELEETPLKMEQIPPEMEPSESLGPLEQPKPSVSFRRNFSTITIDSYRRWNELFDPFFLPPYSPWEPLLPSDAKFLGSQIGFRPIGNGVGGSGLEFSQAIGGNRPSEQFTVVILTYEREQVLMDAIARLYGLPFLNKVVVVWNTEAPPSPDLLWPEIGVPVEVIRTAKNSLNNRFVPYDVIETEAVLSVDDDAHLRHDEIIFAFRVWRENRDRLVGFPGRFHAWDLEHNSWNYNSNYSCELSMILTGAAFYHKYYSYAYTYLMPQAIRDKVDEYTNCEDLAMNFLISHMTRQPPVKVTSRWTFRCPGCPVALSEDDSHFQERHKCMHFFTEVYGYMPLLYTQYRADSVLFKTKIPQDKQKCFKFI